MSMRMQLGRVDSLFAHVEKDWWKDAHNEMYLFTNGDCVEDPAITDTECDELLRIPSIQTLFEHSTGTSPMKVLDLCCGQGRHTINLAKRFPAVDFQGVDHSAYLLNIARERAAAENTGRNTVFLEGDARQIPAANDSFDLVLLMGNSFGYCSEEDNAQLLAEVQRVLKPQAIFLMDNVDGGWMRSNFTPGGWEWIADTPTVRAKSGAKTTNGKLLACREREMSPDKKTMASREIVIDLDGPSVCQDLFYSVRLYDLDEIKTLLHTNGLAMMTEDVRQMSGPTSESVADLGMMESRQLVVAQKTRTTVTANNFCAQDMDTYIHPNLVQSYDPIKGRMVVLSAPVPAGTVLLKDAPYAIVPAVHPARNDAVLCSSVECRRRLPQDAGGIHCQEDCLQDVVWCNSHCQSADQTRHDLECSWLKRHGLTLRETEGEDDFAMLWIIVRIFANRQLEQQARTEERNHLHWESRFQRGWESIDMFRGNQEQWPKDRLEHWERLIKTYLSDVPWLPNTQEVLSLLCKEEANSFGLYPGVTGVFPLPDPPVERGIHYGLAVYPRATICNHSCLPNIIHGPDDRGRMVFTSQRDIAANEECQISYFDLSKYVDVQARQKVLQDYFTFSCVCRRCQEEQKTESHEH
ncbi:hypothetical protein ABOM_001982 [Aspergillus bombycis]|uniref:SET domain-containing protein n=1 Tax=Aspergillus bombycis TaxID=109264 RepID=A0A1F8AAD8_9EURO|nr:hypothetical protein ABOM_001982 [Aspergillus bombycis]OGM48677.1 hypothetical protein ABOM_001982 [Aspergillus bombycis]